MKKFTCFMLLVIALQSVKAQVVQPTLTKPELLEKSKNQRKTAFILLSTGAIVTVVGMAAAVGDMWNNILTDKKQYTGTGAMIAGLSLMGSSIPFFIIAGKNRRASLGYGSSTKMLLPDRSGWAYKSSPQVQVTFTQTIF